MTTENITSATAFDIDPHTHLSTREVYNPQGCVIDFWNVERIRIIVDGPADLGPQTGYQIGPVGAPVREWDPIRVSVWGVRHSNGTPRNYVTGVPVQ